MHLLAASLCVDTALTLERRLVVGYVREHDCAGTNRAQEAAEREGVCRLLASVEADYHGVEELCRHRAPTLPSLARHAIHKKHLLDHRFVADATWIGPMGRAGSSPRPSAGCCSIAPETPVEGRSTKRLFGRRKSWPPHLGQLRPGDRCAVPTVKWQFLQCRYNISNHTLFAGRPGATVRPRGRHG